MKGESEGSDTREELRPGNEVKFRLIRYDDRPRRLNRYYVIVCMYVSSSICI